MIRSPRVAGQGVEVKVTGWLAVLLLGYCECLPILLWLVSPPASPLHIPRFAFGFFLMSAEMPNDLSLHSTSY